MRKFVSTFVNEITAMWHFLQRLFANPKFPSQEQTQAANWVRIILLFLGSLILVNSFAILAGVLDEENALAILTANGIALVALGIIWLIMRTGYLSIAAFILVLILYTLITYINATVFESVRTPNVTTYFALIPLAGLLLGRRVMNQIALLCIVTICIIFYFESTGALIPTDNSRSLTDDLTVLFLNIVLNTLLLNASIRREEEKTDIIRQTAALLSQTNHDLKQSQQQLQLAQAELEQKVAQRTEELNKNNVRLKKEIAERQLLLEALATSEANWRTLAEQLPEVIVRIEHDHAISFINRPIGERCREELNGLPASAIYEELQYKDLLIESLERVLQDGDVISYESEEHRAGKPSWHINRISAIRDGTTILAAILISTDITEQKQTEAAMYQAQKLESLGVLAGGVAHDFNNLLTIIIMQTTLALKKLPANHAIEQKLNRIMDAAERATALTKQMLNYAGRSMFNPQAFDLNELIQGNIHLFSSATAKNIKLGVNLCNSNLSMSGDQGQIQQVIMNLILNAADAIGTQKGAITISTNVQHLSEVDLATEQWFGGEPHVGDYVVLDVEDTGCGMDAQTLSMIFDPFFTTKVTGHGLGLASVIGIIRSHKGGLHVSSAVGKGTRFTIFFPAATVALQSTTEINLEKPFIGSRELVLIIDDEEMVRNGIAEVLSEANLHVMTADSGMNGIQQFREHVHELRLVLLDLSMPEMDGEAVFHEIHSINRQIPIILMSGHSKDGVLERIRNIRSVDFIQKPPTNGLLLRTIESNLRHNHHLVNGNSIISESFLVTSNGASELIGEQV